MEDLPNSRQAARSIGEHRYYTGSPCKHGHVTWRRVDSGACVDCLRYVNRQSSSAGGKYKSLPPVGKNDCLPRSRAEARTLGVDAFMTGKPCKNGHVDERYTRNGSCKSCIFGHSKEARRIPSDAVWVPHYGIPIHMTGSGITYAENRRMNALLPRYAEAILADVREGEPDTAPGLIAQSVILGRALDRAGISLVWLAGQLPLLAALRPAGDAT